MLEGEVHAGEGRFMLEYEGVNRSDANCYWLTERESQRTRFCNSQSRLKQDATERTLRRRGCGTN